MEQYPVMQRKNTAISDNTDGGGQNVLLVIR